MIVIDNNQLTNTTIKQSMDKSIYTIDSYSRQNQSRQTSELSIRVDDPTTHLVVGCGRGPTARRPPAPSEQLAQRLPAHHRSTNTPSLSDGQVRSYPRDPSLHIRGRTKHPQAEVTNQSLSEQYQPPQSRHPCAINHPPSICCRRLTVPAVRCGTADEGGQMKWGRYC